MAKLHIKALAPLSSWQDEGRPAYRHLGIPEGGFLDFRQRDLARMLLGDMLLSIELGQGRSVFQCDAPLVLVVTGERVQLRSGDRFFTPNRIVHLSAGQTLHIELASRLAGIHIAASPNTPPVLGSYSRHCVVDFGIPALRKDMQLDIIPLSVPCRQMGIMLEKICPWDEKIRLVPGPDLELFEATTRQALVEMAFSVSNNSSRMGYRLVQQLPFKAPIPGITSASVCKGIIQVSNDGTPMILMNDCQSTGGYPRIAFVAAVDLPRVANLLPGEGFHFQWISPEENLSLWAKYQSNLRKIKYVLPFGF
jgi:biotin-dependent carboxylase-like uncharacterized protein